MILLKNIIRKDAYYKKIEKYDHFLVRELFFGGRTNNISFYYDCKDDEELKYYDFTSLYPFVLVSYDYPVGFPEVITESLHL